jgi:hypothetical protein
VRTNQRDPCDLQHANNLVQQFVEHKLCTAWRNVWQRQVLVPGDERYDSIIGVLLVGLDSMQLDWILTNSCCAVHCA